MGNFLSRQELMALPYFVRLSCRASPGWPRSLQVFNAVPSLPFSAAATRFAQTSSPPDYVGFSRRATTLRSDVVGESKGVCPLGRRTLGSVREGEAGSDGIGATVGRGNAERFPLQGVRGRLNLQWSLQPFQRGPTYPSPHSLEEIRLDLSLLLKKKKEIIILRVF